MKATILALFLGTTFVHCAPADDLRDIEVNHRISKLEKRIAEIESTLAARNASSGTTPVVSAQEPATENDPLKIVEDYFVTRSFHGVDSQQAVQARRDVRAVASKFDTLYMPYIEGRLEALMDERKELPSELSIDMMRSRKENAIRIKTVTMFLTGESPVLFSEVLNDLSKAEWQERYSRGNEANTRKD